MVLANAYGIIPKILPALLLIVSIARIRHYVKKNVGKGFSMREVLIIIHTVLFLLYLVLQVSFYVLVH